VVYNIRINPTQPVYNIQTNPVYTVFGVPIGHIMCPYMQMWPEKNLPFYTVYESHTGIFGKKIVPYLHPFHAVNTNKK